MADNGAGRAAPAKEGLGTPLFDPKEKAKVDIVFVHGLGGDRINTWTWKNETRKQFWPQTLLPKDCPTARILSFGYNADFAHFYPDDPKEISPELTIDNYSTSLLHALVTLRGTETETRPVIFVAHSLGGLVVANALSKNHGTDEAYKSLAAHTIGAAFLGTPFEGSNKAKYGKFAIRFLAWFTEVQQRSLEDLQESSEKLASIGDSFAKYLKVRDRAKSTPYLEVACFFEERNTYKGNTSVGIIVPKKSAILKGFDAISIPKDHIDMCKFDADDAPEYISVSGKLRQWISNIDKPRKARTTQKAGISIRQSGKVDYSDSSGNQGVQTGHVATTAKGGVPLRGATVYNYNGVSPPLPPAKKSKQKKRDEDEDDDDEDDDDDDSENDQDDEDDDEE